MLIKTKEENLQKTRFEVEGYYLDTGKKGHQKKKICMDVIFVASVCRLQRDITENYAPAYQGRN